jgi:hypothetical protein
MEFPNRTPISNRLIRRPTPPPSPQSEIRPVLRRQLEGCRFRERSLSGSLPAGAYALAGRVGSGRRPDATTG